MENAERLVRANNAEMLFRQISNADCICFSDLFLWLPFYLGRLFCLHSSHQREIIITLITKSTIHFLCKFISQLHVDKQYHWHLLT